MSLTRFTPGFASYLLLFLFSTLLALQPRLEAQQQPLPQPEVIYTGRLLKMDGRSILIRLEDGRFFKVQRTNKTKTLQGGKEIKASTILPGDQVSLFATQDQIGFLIAVRLELVKSATAEERALAAGEAEARPPAVTNAEPVTRPTLRKAITVGADVPPEFPPVDGKPSGINGKEVKLEQKPDKDKVSEKPNRPVLINRSPTEAEEQPSNPEIAELPAPSVSPPAVQPKASAPVMRFDPKPMDPEIEKARDASLEFSKKLPIFICQEFMSRFARATNLMGWQPIDIIASEIIYDEGKETYRNLKINDRPTEKKLEEMGGAWSTGEFASMLNEIFQPETATQFGPGSDTNIKGHRARVYNFEVKQENSHWHVQSDDRSILAAYKGTLWVDAETSRVLSVEIQAADLPKSFPMDVAESTIDYSWVQIGTESALLPIHAESLGCQRGTNYCSRNVIDFRSYRKYTTDSIIKFD